jgi:hypothetical protein
MSGLSNKVHTAVDFLDWWRRGRGIATLPEPPRQRRVLFIDLHSIYAGAKVTAVLGKGLRLSGWHTDVLLPARSRLFRAVYGSLGPMPCHYLEDFMSLVMKVEAKDRAAALLERLNDVSDLLELDLDGIRVGRHAASKVVRTLRIGSINLKDREHRSLLLDTLSESLVSVEAGRAAIETLRPDAAVFNEKGYTPAGELYDLCLELDVDPVLWVSSHAPQAYVFKRYTRETQDDHPYALAPSTWEWVKSQPWSAARDKEATDEIENHYRSGSFFSRVELQKGKSLINANDVRERLGLDPTKKTAVIFSHIFYDATFFFGTSLYPDYEKWLIATVRAAMTNTNINWVVKLHPVNVWRSKMDGVPMRPLEVEALQRALPPLPDHIKLMLPDTTINTFALFPITDFGVTVRGTVGIELASYGIPVVTAGTGRYEGLGFTSDPASQADYVATLQRLHELPALGQQAVETARRYALAVFRDRPLAFNAIRQDVDHEAKASHLKINASLRVDDPQAFSKSRDIGSFARWMENRELADLFGARDVLAPESGSDVPGGPQ